MPGPSTQTTTNVASTAPSNPDVNPTLSMLLKGVQKEYQARPEGYYFPESTYAGTGATTNNALSNMLSASSRPNFFNQAENFAGGLIQNGGLNPGMNSDIDLTRMLAGRATNPSLTEDTLLPVARGDFLNNMDPAYQAIVDRTANQTAADINASMGANGAYGSNIHTDTLASAIGDLRNRAAVENRQFEIGRQQQALGAIEGLRQQGINTALGASGQAFGMGQQGIGNAMGASNALPGLFNAGLLPSQAALGVGQLQDADRQAALQGRADLALRQANAPTDYLAKLTSLLAGNASTGGMNSTSSTTSPIQQPNPLQLLLGGGLGALALL